MKASNLEIGAQVHLISNTSRKGKVVANKVADDKHDSHVIIRWNPPHGRLEEVDVSELESISLEKEYENIRKELEAAAHHLSEANKLASSKGTSLYEIFRDGMTYEGTYDDPIHMINVFDQLDNGGWQTSMMHRDC